MLYRGTIAALVSAVIAISPISIFFLGGIGARSAAIELALLLITLALVAAVTPSALWPNRAFLVFTLCLVAAVTLAEFSHISRPTPFPSEEFDYARRGAVVLVLVLVMLVGASLRAGVPTDVTWVAMRLACLLIFVFSVFVWYRLTGLQITLDAPRSAQILVSEEEDFGANLFTLFALFVAVTALFFKSLLFRLPLLVYSLALAISFGSRNTFIAIIGAYAAYTIVRLQRQRRFTPWLIAAYALVGGLTLVMIFFPGLVDWLMNTVLDLDSSGRGTGSGFTGRTEIWARVAAWWWQNPIVGNGFRTSPEYAHNGYLQILGELGIVGLAWFVLLLGTAAWQAFKQSDEREFAALFAYIFAFALYNIFEARPTNASNAFTIGFYFLAAFVWGRALPRKFHPPIDVTTARAQP